MSPSMLQLTKLHLWSIDFVQQKLGPMQLDCLLTSVAFYKKISQIFAKNAPKIGDWSSLKYLQVVL